MNEIETGNDENGDARLSKAITLFLVNVLMALAILTLWLGPVVLIYAALALTVTALALIGVIASGRT